MKLSLAVVAGGVSNLPDQSHVTDCHTDQVCRQAMKEKPGAIETFYYIRNQFSPISLGRLHNSGDISTIIRLYSQNQDWK